MSKTDEDSGDTGKTAVRRHPVRGVLSWALAVLTGPDAGSLTEVGSSNWKGLETMISVPTVDTNVQVVAYDGQDNKIGQSGLIPLGE